jgi:hypothetical protein
MTEHSTTRASRASQRPGAKPLPRSAEPTSAASAGEARQRFAIRYGLHAIQLLPATLLLLLTLVSFQFTEWPSAQPLVACCGALAGVVALAIAGRWLRKLGLVACIIAALAIAITVAAVVSLVVFEAIRHTRVVAWFRPTAPYVSYLGMGVRVWAPGCLLIGAIVGVVQVGLWMLAVRLPPALEAERVRTLEIENLRLEANELRIRAEVERLRSQLEPHFLLNTLNLISGLVTADPERARTVLVTLGDLLQDALVDHDDLHTIDRELVWLRRYVEILEARHGDMLRVHWHVAPLVEAALLPRLLLQPLLENAVRHGALRLKTGGSVAIHIDRMQDLLVCAIVDNGPGLGGDRPGAVGLDNVRRRLAVHFPTGQLALLSDAAGTRATVSVPFTIDGSTVPTRRQAGR